jgi:hypothetical protein
MSSPISPPGEMSEEPSSDQEELTIDFSATSNRLRKDMGPEFKENVE